MSQCVHSLLNTYIHVCRLQKKHNPKLTDYLRLWVCSAMQRLLFTAGRQTRTARPTSGTYQRHLPAAPVGTVRGCGERLHPVRAPRLLYALLLALLKGQSIFIGSCPVKTNSASVPPITVQWTLSRNGCQVKLSVDHIALGAKRHEDSGGVLARGHAIG